MLLDKGKSTHFKATFKPNKIEIRFFQTNIPPMTWCTPAVCLAAAGQPGQCFVSTASRAPDSFLLRHTLCHGQSWIPYLTCSSWIRQSSGMFVNCHVIHNAVFSNSFVSNDDVESNVNGWLKVSGGPAMWAVSPTLMMCPPDIVPVSPHLISGQTLTWTRSSSSSASASSRAPSPPSGVSYRANLSSFLWWSYRKRGFL